MLVFQWNALKPGDRVAVHDDAAPDLALREGTVAFVRTRPGAPNEIAIRGSAPTGGVVRPRRQAVHMLPLDRRFECWRCDALAGTTAAPERRSVAA